MTLLVTKRGECAVCKKRLPSEHRIIVPPLLYGDAPCLRIHAGECEKTVEDNLVDWLFRAHETEPFTRRTL